jgi:Peptidase inhibitor I78 family
MMLSLVLAVAASASQTHESGAGYCDAKPAQNMIGKRNTKSLRRRALIITRARVLRAAPPGVADTDDYRIDRLNFEISPNGRVLRVSCY